MFVILAPLPKCYEQPVGLLFTARQYCRTQNHLGGCGQQGDTKGPNTAGCHVTCKVDAECTDWTQRRAARSSDQRLVAATRRRTCRLGGRSQRPSRGRSVQTHRRATTLRTSDHIWIYKEADFPPDLALRSQQSVYSELLQLRNPRLCTHHSDPIPSLRSSPSGTDTLPSVVGEHGDLWSRDDRHQRLPLNKGTSRSKGNRLATTQSRIDLL